MNFDNALSRKENLWDKQKSALNRFLALAKSEGFVVEKCMLGYMLSRRDMKIRIWVKKLV